VLSADATFSLLFKTEYPTAVDTTSTAIAAEIIPLIFFLIIITIPFSPQFIKTDIRNPLRSLAHNFSDNLKH
jgi:hypothetical protein